MIINGHILGGVTESGEEEEEERKSKNSLILNLFHLIHF